VAKDSVRIVIADRQPVFLRGLQALLVAEHDLRVVASCHDGATCTEAIREHSPHLALLDMSLWGAGELQVKAKHLATRIVLFSMSFASSEIAKAIAMGAYGVISKEIAPNILLRCLRHVAVGRRLSPLPESPGELDTDLESAPKSLTSILTKREQEITNLVCAGLSNKEIGRQLHISEGTTKVHLHHVFEKLAINNRTALAAFRANYGER
jgi:two-component system, NarL family, nitrate/nitrite response regulator NarL